MENSQAEYQESVLKEKTPQSKGHPTWWRFCAMLAPCCIALLLQERRECQSGECDVELYDMIQKGNINVIECEEIFHDGKIDDVSSEHTVCSWSRITATQSPTILKKSVVQYWPALSKWDNLTYMIAKFSSIPLTEVYEQSKDKFAFTNYDDNAG